MTEEEGITSKKLYQEWLVKMQPIWDAAKIDRKFILTNNKLSEIQDIDNK